MKPVISILGMHRSGTSCLAGSLQALGLQCGEVVVFAAHNRKGNRENIAIRQLNDDVLRASGGTWDEPPQSLHWTPELAARRDAIIEHFEALPGEQWAFKDPRTVLTLPFWRERVRGLRLVVTFRHPIAVSRSLAARDGMPFERGLSLWLAYNRRILDSLDRDVVPMVSFDVSGREYQEAITTVARHLSVVTTPGEAEQHDIFFDESLRHQTPDGCNLDDMLTPEARGVYSELASRYSEFHLDHGSPEQALNRR